MQRRLLVVLYMISGAAALVYEVIWTRLLTLQLGHTVAAASTVLAAFMGGLAVGAWLAGRFVTRRTNAAPDLPEPASLPHPMQIYAGLEVVIALLALLLPLMLRASVPALAWAYADGSAPVRFALVRVAISLLLVGIPATAMGATYPVAADWLARLAPDPTNARASAALLYASNTAGAAVGALAAGFWLIPALGLSASTWVSVALNGIAAAGAMWLSTVRNSERVPTGIAQVQATRTAKAVKTAKPPRKRETQDSLQPSRASRSAERSSVWLVSAAIGVSGFAALVYEVAWTRLLALVIGPTTYAFSTMAAAFVTGLAIGSTLGSPLSRRTTRPMAWLAATLIVGAVAATSAAWYTASRLPLTIAVQVADPNVIFGRIVFEQAIVVALLMLPSTLILGAAFPLALAAAGAAGENAGGVAARVYTANTIGAILGALAAGFLLIPILGLRSTFEAAAIVSVVAGAVGLLRQIKSWAGAAIAAASVATIVALPGWDRELLASGAYKYAPYLQSADLDTILRAGTLEYYKEGAAATVSVRRLTGVRSLAIDGKVDASNGADMLTQRLLGLLPVLLHGHARSVAIIGLGSGVTAGSALAPGTVEHADVIEISPEVVEASHAFDAESGQVLSQKTVRLIIGDGRSHLLLTPRRYDVIVSEPSNPWMAGVAALFTREFFEAARARLEPDGLLCQWAHTYDISAEDLRSIARTFASVFPDGTMWLVGEGDLLFIGGSARGLDRRLDEIAVGYRKGTTPALLASLGIDPAFAPFNLLSLYAGGPREIRQYSTGAMVQTDDRMALEYSAPRGIYGRTTTDNAVAIRALAVQPPPAVRAALDAGSDAAWTSRGNMLLKADAFALAYDAYSRALALNSGNPSALKGLSDAAPGARREQEERKWLETTASREPANAAVRIELARVLAARGEFDAAVAAATKALELAPGEPRAGEELASILADKDDSDRLAPLADALVKEFPGRPDPEYYRATALFMRGQIEDSLTAVQPLAKAHPEHARAQNLMGAACAILGRRECARAAFQASITANPRDVATYVNAATFELQVANPRGAMSLFAEALALDQQSDAARKGLAQARAQSATNPR
jgi:spermidine synthase